MDDEINDNIEEEVKDYYGKETTIDHVEGDELAYIDSGEKDMVSYCKDLAKKYRNECKIIAKNKDGSIYMSFPFSWVQIIPQRNR